jgi:hypothetical protein
LGSTNCERRLLAETCRPHPTLPDEISGAHPRDDELANVIVYSLSSESRCENADCAFDLLRTGASVSTNRATSPHCRLQCTNCVNQLLAVGNLYGIRLPDRRHRLLPRRLVLDDYHLGALLHSLSQRRIIVLGQ